jgi:hypothetical protein
MYLQAFTMFLTASESARKPENNRKSTMKMTIFAGLNQHMQSASNSDGII